METLRAKVTRNPLILEKIFSHLSTSDIKTVALVNRAWNSVVEQPRYWTWVEAALQETNFDEFFQSRRFVSLSEVGMDSLYPEQIKSIFNYIIESEDMHLKRLYLTGQDLASVEPNILSEAVVRLEEVSMTNLSPEQMNCIVTAILKSDKMKLKRIDLDHQNFSLVSADILSKALIKLEYVDLYDNTILPPEHLDSIFKAITQSEALGLKELYLGGVNLSSVPPNIISQALVKLEDVGLFETELTPRQVNSIFRAIYECPTKILKSLDLRSNNISSVPPFLLSVVVANLEEVGLNKTRLTTPQLQAILWEIVRIRQPVLRSLDIFGTEDERFPTIY